MEVGEEHADVTVRNSDIDISLEQENICTESLCIENNDMNKLQCGQCKRKVHYKCTRLPAYQLQRYLVASLGQYYSKFLCSNCVVVPDSIQKELAAADNIVSLENELTMQKEKIEIYEQELKELRKLVTPQQRQDTATYKKRKFGDCNYNGEAEVSLSNENKNTIDGNDNVHLNIQEINNMFEKRFELMEIKMTEMIKKNLTKTQDTNDTIHISYANATNNPKNTNNSNFRNIVVAAKNEELIEEKDKRLRENNIVIHGKRESENNEDSDKQFVNDMIKDISVGAITAKSIIRIGKTENEKTRPIKVIFNNKEEKSKVMSNLRHLKGKEVYNKISITDDYTMSERKMVKDYVDMAKQKNRELGNDAKTIILVRGTPKNGLYLKEVMKEKKVQTQNEAMQTSSH